MDWSDYFLSIAEAISKRSSCGRRRIGAVIVNEKNIIISTGYNGTPSGMLNCVDGGCARLGKDKSIGTGVSLPEDMCMHAEENAIIFAARYGQAVDGAMIYCTVKPCHSCLKKIIQAGIRHIIYDGYNGEWSYDQASHESYMKLVNESGIVVTRHYQKK
ncbi:MAG: dCMP deaminase family protein [Candidatus Poribacteria bacterium]|nr:dCMP deaminase family protein [Candidatus Poribacteria bacterium]